MGELIEIFDKDMLVWKTGVIVRVQHDYSYSFKWSTYPDAGNSAVQEAGNPESSNSGDWLSEKQETGDSQSSNSGDWLIEEQEAGDSQSSNSDAGHVCNPILIPKTPSSGDTPQLVVYLLHPPHTHTIRGDAKRQKQKHSEERLVSVNSGMESAGLRPSLWWNPVSTQWYTVTSAGDTLVKEGEMHSGTGGAVLQCNAFLHLQLQISDRKFLVRNYMQSHVKHARPRLSQQLETVCMLFTCFPLGNHFRLYYQSAQVVTYCVRIHLFFFS